MSIDLSNIRIIQSSPGRTGSTLLTNILHGLYCDVSVFYTKNIDPTTLDNYFIIKTHDTDLDNIIINHGNYKLFFVCSERSEINQTINSKYKSYKNVIVFSYETELRETENFTVSDIVNNIHSKLLNFLPQTINLYANVDRAVDRVNSMNLFYETIKNLSFSYYDDFYKIHGSHRHRKYI